MATSHKEKTNFLSPPAEFNKCFVKLNKEKRENTNITLYDLVVFEICVRLCAQSLFFTNSSFYFNLAIDILVNLVGERSVYNLKLKKSSVGKNSNTILSDSPTKLNTLSNYIYLTNKQAIKTFHLIVSNFSNLFKSISIQIYNFVNNNSTTRLEIEKSLHRLYTYLCKMTANDYKQFQIILIKFIESGCFLSSSQSASPCLTPTKLTTITTTLNSNPPVVYSFFQFAFRFLIIYDTESKNANNETQLETIHLFELNLNQFLEMNKKLANTDSMLISVILALTWCLTSECTKVRCSALKLMEKFHIQLAESQTIWSEYLKK